MQCRYCKFFFVSPKRYVNSIGENESLSRLCETINKIVSGKEEGCDNFVKHERFWCNKNDCWLTFEICKGRRTAKKCGFCKQRKEIEGIEEYEERKERIKNFRLGGSNVGRGDSEVGRTRRDNRRRSSLRNHRD